MSRQWMALMGSMAIMLAAALQAGDRITPPAVPGDIEVEQEFKPFLVAHAIGTQNYMCAATSKGYRWLPIGPQATGFDLTNGQVLTHFQSKNPSWKDELHATWQDSRDSSLVWARKVKGSSDAAYVSPDAIEWLLLEVTGQLTGPAGGDRLTSARYIQRVNTVGGREPSIPCGDGTVNTRQFVDYEADYYFYK